MKSFVAPTHRFHNDTMQIQLWLSGRDFEGVDIPALIRREFRRSIKELLTPFRSVFDPRSVDGIGERRIEKRAAKMGVAAPEFFRLALNLKAQN